MQASLKSNDIIILRMYISKYLSLALDPKMLFLHYSATTVSGTILLPAQGGTTCWRVLLAMVLMIDPLSSLRTQLVQNSGKIIIYLCNLTPYLTLYVFNWDLDPGLQ